MEQNDLPDINTGKRGRGRPRKYFTPEQKAEADRRYMAEFRKRAGYRADVVLSEEAAKVLSDIRAKQDISISQIFESLLMQYANPDLFSVNGTPEAAAKRT